MASICLDNWIIFAQGGNLLLYSEEFKVKTNYFLDITYMVVDSKVDVEYS